jgi:hypothetical protein
MPQMFGNLSIRPRMVGLLAVPVAAVALLGATVAAAGWGERAGAADDRRLAALAGQAVAAAHELQEERARAVAWTAGPVRGGQAGLAARRGRADRALAAYRSGAAALCPTGDPALDPAVAVAGLLGVALELAHRLDAPGPARTARLLLALAAAKEATGRERSLLAATPAAARPGRARDGALAARLTAAAAVARHEVIAVRAAAGDRLDRVDRALATPGARRARRLELALLQPATGQPAVGDPGPGGPG